MTDAIVNALIQAKPKKAKASAEASFFAQSDLDVAAIEVSVSGLGALTFPMTVASVKALLGHAQPASYGLGEKTLLDKTVRDAHEVKADQLTVHWKTKGWDTMLQRMRGQLGLPDTARLVPHLHNLLVYAKGQFFKTHQDSEKLDGMVASLVVVLPSAHIGGELTIHQHKETCSFVSEQLEMQALKCVAFYADCKHEVAKVKQGYRVALTYNLVLETVASEAGQTQANDATSSVALVDNPALEKALADYFAPPKTSEAATGAANTTLGAAFASQKTHHLVYLLDHSYTEHSLRWQYLKAEDRPRVGAFLQAAKKLGLVAHLALADIHENWTATGGDDYGYGSRRSRRSNAEPEPEELLETEVTLSAWLDVKGQPQAYTNLPTRDDQMGTSLALADTEPDDSDYEGYTGNAGNTLDYWYSRGAIVLWRQDDAVLFDFALATAQSLAKATALMAEPGNEEPVRAIIAKAGAYFFKNSQYPTTTDFVNIPPIALYINDPDIALQLMARFSLSNLTLAFVPVLAQLQKVYGVAWCEHLLKQWAAQSRIINRYQPDLPPPLQLDQFLRDADTHAVDQRLCRFLCADTIAQQIHQDAQSKQNHRHTQAAAVPVRWAAFATIAQSWVWLDDKSGLSAWVAHVKAHDALYPAVALGQAVLTLKEDKGLDYASFGGDLWLQHIQPKIAQAFALGLRDADDWSIPFALTCQCANCLKTALFLQSSTEVSLVFAVPESQRHHVSESLAGSGLPLKLETLKTGSPYKLVITKLSALYKDAVVQFDKVVAVHRVISMSM